MRESERERGRERERERERLLIVADCTLPRRLAELGLRAQAERDRQEESAREPRHLLSTHAAHAWDAPVDFNSRSGDMGPDPGSFELLKDSLGLAQGMIQDLD